MFNPTTALTPWLFKYSCVIYNDLELTKEVFFEVQAILAILFMGISLTEDIKCFVTNIAGFTLSYTFKTYLSGMHCEAQTFTSP